VHIDAIFLGQHVDLLLKRGDLFVFVITRALEALGVGLGDLFEEALVPNRSACLGLPSSLDDLRNHRLC
jgi:hypothetical protein